MGAVAASEQRKQRRARSPGAAGGRPYTRLTAAAERFNCTATGELCTAAGESCTVAGVLCPEAGVLCTVAGVLCSVAGCYVPWLGS